MAPTVPLQVYSPQEGRGIGLAAKVAAYALQEQHGLDTVDANRALGLPDEARSYEVVPLILRELGVASVRLLTNNPFKVDSLRTLGVAVDGLVRLAAPEDELSDACRSYLSAKASRMGHTLKTPSDAPPPRPALAPPQQLVAKGKL